MLLRDLGTMNYRDAWALQEQAHSEVLAGEPERVLFVQHPPVITFGRRPGIERNLLASDDQLKKLGVEIVHSDRGGDITFHGPGQLVAYPIVRLADHGFSVSGYVHALEDALIGTLADYGLHGRKEPSAVGVWVTYSPSPGTPGEGRGEGSSGADAKTPTLTLPRSTRGGDNSKRTAEIKGARNTGRGDDSETLAKIAAIGVRIRRGVTLHGLALNVTTDLSFFDLIVPCGLSGRAVTSMSKILGERCPSMSDVKSTLIRRLNARLRATGLPWAASAGE